MAEERRTHIVVELHARRLGMYLEPVDTSSGCILVRFENVDEQVGEAESCGLLRPGFRLVAINDIGREYASFASIIATLVAAPRPVRLTWRDPSVPEFRDRFGFLRSKMHVDREAAYARMSEDARKRNDHEWVRFLSELGGKRGASFGVMRLMRDARGQVLFPMEPSIRLNAVSPLHARMTGISSSDTITPLTNEVVRRVNTSDVTTSAPENGTIVESLDAHVVVSIFKRCWSPGGIGVAVPPGLDVNLPGALPSKKHTEQYTSHLTRLVLHGGVPAAFRASVWFELSGAHAKSALHPPGYYSQLCAQKPPAEAAYAILKDLDRTFPGHAVFDKRSGTDALKRLLGAFSVHNSDIGYCQGINFVAGFLLLLLTEEQAFWILDVLVNEILPPDYYNGGLVGVHADQRVLAHLVSEIFPDIAETLAAAGIEISVVSVEWFMTFFSTVLPTETALRVWDALFLRGADVLFRVSLALFHEACERILSVARSSTTTSVQVSQCSGDRSPDRVTSGSGTPIVSRSNSGAVFSSAPSPMSSFFKPRDTVAETAQRFFAAAAAAGMVSSGSVAASPMPGSPTRVNTGSLGDGSGPVVRGGTCRPAGSIFPAMFGLVKALPSAAHDVDSIMRLCFPLSSKDAKVCPIPWEVYASTSRVSKLRSVALAEARAEYAVAEATRAARMSASSGVAQTPVRALDISPLAIPIDTAISKIGRDEAHGVQASSSCPSTIDIGPVSVPLSFVEDLPGRDVVSSNSGTKMEPTSSAPVDKSPMQGELATAADLSEPPPAIEIAPSDEHDSAQYSI